jgi:hypothetical protein
VGIVARNGRKNGEDGTENEGSNDRLAWQKPLRHRAAC